MEIDFEARFKKALLVPKAELEKRSGRLVNQTPSANEAIDVLIASAILAAMGGDYKALDALNSLFGEHAGLTK